MAISSRQDLSEEQQEQSEYDEITQFFDLDAASVPYEDGLSEILAFLLSDALYLEYEPITEEKTNEFEAWLEEALKQDNNTGGRGPYVSSQGADTWFGVSARDSGGACSSPNQQRSADRKPRASPTDVVIDPKLIAKIIKAWDEDYASRNNHENTPSDTWKT